MALILIVISLLGLVNNPIIHTQASYMYNICPNTTTFTPNSTYQKNLNTLLASLPSIAADPTTNGFANYGAGRSMAEMSYGQFLCRGDLSKDQCQECVKNATQEAVQRCPVEKTSIIWHDECMLRYSNESFFLRNDMEPSVLFKNQESLNNDTTRFTQLVNDTLKGMATKLAAGSGIFGKMFEAAEVNFTNSESLYAFAQCLPLLSTKKCISCLMQSIEGLATCCSTSKGGRVLTPSCNVRFELYPFYNLSVLSSLAPEPAPGPVPFLSPPIEAPAPGEPPVQYPPPPAPAPRGPVQAPPQGSPSEVPPPPGAVEGPSTVPTTPAPGSNGNNMISASTFVTIAAPIVASIALFNF